MALQLEQGALASFIGTSSNVLAGLGISTRRPPARFEGPSLYHYFPLTRAGKRAGPSSLHLQSHFQTPVFSETCVLAVNSLHNFCCVYEIMVFGLLASVT